MPTTTSTIDTSAGAGIGCSPSAEVDSGEGGTPPIDTRRRALTTGVNDRALNALLAEVGVEPVRSTGSSRDSVLGGVKSDNAFGRGRRGRPRAVLC